ncbi:MAG TPA: ABC transporter ATP-binding protein [Rhizobiaceae bacterium]|nr:ABC transporter ATP-binding protein [Rhizobiaceae bacterium]
MTLRLQNVQKVYPSGFIAVNGINLDVEHGEFFTLLGPSGCGKTTTLRMIAGLETPSAGKIFIGGRDFTDTHPRKRDVAMVFQSYALYPHMTVRGNLGLNLEIKGVSRAEIEERLQNVARMLDITLLLDNKPGELSGGQRQRVALGRALIRRPNIFLMDEPLSNLDLKLRERTRTELKKLHETLRVTTIYVTHDQAEALVLSNRIGVMNAGNLIQVGTPQEIYDRPRNVFVAKFIGTPSVNLLNVSVQNLAGLLAIRLTGSEKPLGSILLPVADDVFHRLGPAGTQLILGVRPEAIAVLTEAHAEAVPAEIELVEPMGYVNNIVLRFGKDVQTTADGEPLIAVVTSSESHERGEKAWIRLRPERLVLFDRTSERALAILAGERWEGV